MTPKVLMLILDAALSGMVVPVLAGNVLPGPVAPRPVTVTVGLSPGPGTPFRLSGA